MQTFPLFSTQNEAWNYRFWFIIYIQWLLVGKSHTLLKCFSIKMILSLAWYSTNYNFSVLYFYLFLICFSHAFTSQCYKINFNLMIENESFSSIIFLSKVSSCLGKVGAGSCQFLCMCMLLYFFFFGTCWTSDHNWTSACPLQHKLDYACWRVCRHVLIWERTRLTRAHWTPCHPNPSPSVVSQLLHHYLFRGFTHF